MKLDFPSVLLGCGVGAGAMLLGRRLRPLLLEVATSLYRLQARALAAPYRWPVPNRARNMPTRSSSRT